MKVRHRLAVLYSGLVIANGVAWAWAFAAFGGNALLMGTSLLAYGLRLRPLLRLVTRSWHLYPLGVLFGIGFDVAGEVAVLGLSAGEAARGLPVATVLVFPALFAAAMALADTLDGTLMIGVYGWALEA